MSSSNKLKSASQQVSFLSSLELSMSSEVTPHHGNYFQMCAIRLFFTFKICYVSTSVMFFITTFMDVWT